MADKIRWAGYPSAVVFAEPDGKKAVQHLLWGDWLRLKTGRRNGFAEVHARGCDGWMREEEVQEERLLELIFVDIGQGDGCLVVTPKDQVMVIDAGDGDNMFRFLRWRFGKFSKPFAFHAAVISHPDSDHYYGFDRLFDEPNASFGTLYHNGILERAGKDSLGPKTTTGRPRFLQELVRDTAELRAFLADESRWKGKRYPTMLAKGLGNGSFAEAQALSVEDGHLPGFGPDRELSIEILGPVREQGRLRWLSSVGKTKNGHSVVLKLVYRDVRVLLGGDLNIPSEELLLEHHTGLSMPPKSPAEYDTIVEAARRVFEVDVAKACHHGSSDFSSLYLEATNPIATVVSSGDDEPHAHPRADALGTMGRHSRGDRPLIFSTELSRSTKENVKQPNVLRSELKRLRKEIEEHPTATKADRRRKERLQKSFDALVDTIDRSVAVYGAINVRTDGRRVVLAQKLERPRSKGKKWDIYRIEPQGDGGPLRFVSKH